MNHTIFATVAATCLLMLAAGRNAAAQSDPRLTQAVGLAQDGNRDSAATLVAQVRKEATPGSALYTEALYTSGILATNPDTMRRILQQVIVEQSLSPWADDALLRLAQLDYASGNLPATMRDLERLRTDFPNSDIFADASFWAARTYFDARQERAGCEWVGMGLARAGDTPSTVRDQLQVFARRCSATALAEGSAKAPPAPPRDTIVLAQADSMVAGRETRDSVDRSSVVGRQSSDASRDTQDVVVRDSASRVPSPASGALVAHLDTTTHDPRPATRDPQPTTVFRVQVVAAATQAAADEAARKLRDRGYESRIASEGGYFKVRAGGYSSRADALSAVRRLRADFPGAFLVVDK